jgi:hypothetical protein
VLFASQFLPACRIPRQVAAPRRPDFQEKTMLKLPLKILLAGAFLAMVPTFSEALPQYCDRVCRCTGSCNWICNGSEGGIAITNCGAWGICRGQCRTEPQSAFEQAVAASENEAQAAAGESCADSQSQRSESGAEQGALVLLGE